MGRLSPEQRSLVSKFRRQGISINVLMNAFGCSRTTIWYWSIQDLRTRFNIVNNPNGKVTIEVEATILCLRQTFKWGTARIRQGLDNLPEFMRAELKIILQFEPVQNYDLSRQSINKILKKWKINGYSRKKKAWKFFRAKYPNELWQLDLKRFKFGGKKYELLVVIDDYSRFLLKLHVFNHSPNTAEICCAVKELVKKYHPEKILTDNNPFQNSWEEWCKSVGVEAIFAHPYYPQDKGKVERAIRNIAEEFVYLLTQFPRWFNGNCLEEWRVWYNKDRKNNGIKDYPANLYVKY